MLGYIFISHDMKAVRAMSDRIAVMKDGKFVEVGSRERIFDNPQEEYTRKLISASIWFKDINNGILCKKRI